MADRSSAAVGARFGERPAARTITRASVIAPRAPARRIPCLSGRSSCDVAREVADCIRLVQNPRKAMEKQLSRLGGRFRSAATLAAIRLRLSRRFATSGQVEGQVNRLKTPKQSMYGQAGVELIRVRVLPIAALTQHQLRGRLRSIELLPQPRQTGRPGVT